jgi:hypothetical protein
MRNLVELWICEFLSTEAIVTVMHDYLVSGRGGREARDPLDCSRGSTSLLTHVRDENRRHVEYSRWACGTNHIYMRKTM